MDHPQKKIKLFIWTHITYLYGICGTFRGGRGADGVKYEYWLISTK